ncbi:MAG TPA: ribbon-helix-helix protein, CopG family [Candidatus Thermoplasmatota archaeon]|nr:ribbon-helix-helix protein, CopG family [Candidatus Thermoplasmatota archaeon]
MADETVPVAARLPAPLVEKLDELAPSMGGTRSDVLRALVEQYEAVATLDADAPLFAPALPAGRGARPASFVASRFDRVGSRKR